MTNKETFAVGVGEKQDLGTSALLLIGGGVLGLWAAAVGFDQTLGSIGLFESLSFAAGSLDGVEWWGIPWFEIACLMILAVALVAVLVRVGRGRSSGFAAVATSGASVVCWFGIWVFSMSLIATIRSGQGLPSLTGWSSGTSVVACVLALIAVDLCWYLEHRIQHALGHSRHRPSATSRDKVWNVVVDVAGSVVSAIVLSLVGFELVVIAVARLIVEVYRVGVRVGAVPAFAGLLFITSKDVRSHDASTRHDLGGFGGVFSVWDRLFGTLSRTDDSAASTVRTDRRFEEVLS